MDVGLVLVRGDGQSGAIQQAGEHFLHKDVKGTDGILQHDIAGAGVELIRKGAHIVADIAVGNTDAFGPPGRAGGIQHIGGAFRVLHGVALPGGRLHAADLTICIADGETVQFGRKGVFRQHKIHLCLGHHVMDAPGGKIRLGWDISAAAFEYRQNRGNHLGSVTHDDADAVYFLRKAARDHIHHVGQLSKSHGAVVFNDSRGIFMFFNYFLKKRINRIHRFISLSVYLFNIQ